MGRRSRTRESMVGGSKGTTFNEEGNEFISRLDSRRAWHAVTNNFKSVEILAKKRMAPITGQEMAYAIKGRLLTDTK